MDLGLNGKVAMVTGASRGLGRAMALALAAEGVRISICARGGDLLEQAAAELKAAGASVLAQPSDVNDAAAMEAWTAATVEQFGGVDILVNNAGGAKVGTLKQLDDEGWRQAFDLNFFSAVRLARLAGAGNAEAGWRLDYQCQLDLRPRGGRSAQLQHLQGRADLVDQGPGA